MKLSKRTLILTALAILMVIAAVLSVYMEKQELEKIYEDVVPENDEIDPLQGKKTTKKIKEPEKPVNDGSETATI